jgi:hypothetical protein
MSKTETKKVVGTKVSICQELYHIYSLLCIVCAVETVCIACESFSMLIKVIRTQRENKNSGQKKLSYISSMIAAGNLGYSSTQVKAKLLKANRWTVRLNDNAKSIGLLEKVGVCLNYCR